MTDHLFRLMRPGDWVKNVFILPALVFSERLSDVGAIVPTVLTFVAFCLLSSGFYALNDVLDAKADRAHPVKRHRPVASGAVSERAAIVLGAVLIVLGLSGGYFVNLSVGVTLTLYAVMQAAYNGFLKRVLLVDVVTLAVGFGLRAAAGLAERFGKTDRALACWRLLAAGSEAGTEPWYEAKFHLISLLAEVDPVRARLVMDQYKQLNPEYGPQPWAARLLGLDRRIGRSGLDDGAETSEPADNGAVGDKVGQS